MLYVQSTNANDGSMTQVVTFDVGTDGDVDNVLVNNRFSQAQPFLPQDVKNIGVTIKKSLAFPLMAIRPQLGIGNASFSFANVSQSHLYLEPGFVALVKLGLLYVGGDVNLLAIPGIDQGGGDTKTYTSFTIHGQIGIQF
jgi:hypothetical protein